MWGAIMKTFLTFFLAVISTIAYAGLPPEGKYIEFCVKNHGPNGDSYLKEYPLKLELIRKFQQV